MSSFRPRTALLTALLLLPVAAAAQPTLLDAIAHILDASADGFVAIRGEQTLGGPLPRWDGTYRIPGTQGTMYCTDVTCSYSLLHDTRPSPDTMHQLFAAFQEAYPDWIAVPNDGLPTGPMTAYFDCGPVTRAVVLGGVAASVTVGEAPGYLPPACEGQVAVAPPRPQPAAAQTGCLSGSCVDGTGRFRIEDGTVYDGDFLDGIQHGQGVMTFPNGSSYTGGWSDGQKDGVGTTRLVPEGIVTVGRWQAGRRQGLHLFMPTDGPTEYGVFVDDELVRTLTEAEALAYGADVRRGFGFTYTLHPAGSDVTLIVAVGPGGPAEQAGLRAGDHLVSVDGTALPGLDLQTIARHLADASARTTVALGIFRPGTETRSGQEGVLSVTPGPFSVPALQAVDAEARRQLGMPSMAPPAPPPAR